MLNEPRRLKTECKRGHALTADNLRYDGHGHRYCKACAKLREQQRWAESVVRRKRLQPPAVKSVSPAVILCRAELERILSKRAERQRWIHEQMEARRAQWPQPTWRDSVGYMRRDA